MFGHFKSTIPQPAVGNLYDPVKLTFNILFLTIFDKTNFDINNFDNPRNLNDSIEQMLLYLKYSNLLFTLIVIHSSFLFQKQIGKIPCEN